MIRRPLRYLTFAALLAIEPRDTSAQDFLDQLEETLTVSALDSAVRTRLSGTLDLEGIHFSPSVPGLNDTRFRNYFQPRLSLFLDSQLGPQLYLFAQTRVDRGFDGGDHGARIRLDEYALRWTPWEDGRFTLAAGKFVTIVGVWNERHLSWDNPFINSPLPYDNVTLATDMEVEAPEDFTGREITYRNKYEYLPVIWRPSYASGVSMSGRIGKFEYAAELKNAALSSRPHSWELADTGLSRPSFHARVAWRPSPMWRIGVSAAEGPYLREEATPELPSGRDLSHYQQRVLAQDVSFAWRHWQIWAEAFESRFEIPYLGAANTFAYYVEAKYKFAPQAFAAVRWNQQFYDDVRDGLGGRAKWGRDQWRIDTSLAYRFTPHAQLKLQYSVDRGRRAEDAFSHTIGAQFTVRF